MTPMLPLAALEQHDEFLSRHIGHDGFDMAAMLAAVGSASLDELIGQTVPAAIRLEKPLELPGPKPWRSSRPSPRRTCGRNR